MEACLSRDSACTIGTVGAGARAFSPLRSSFARAAFLRCPAAWVTRGGTPRLGSRGEDATVLCGGDFARPFPWKLALASSAPRHRRDLRTDHKRGTRECKSFTSIERGKHRGEILGSTVSSTERRTVCWNTRSIDFFSFLF